MPALKIRKLILLSIGLSISGCGIDASHEYGRVAALPSGRTTEIPLTLPANTPSISRHFRREGASSKSEHRGFDILVPSTTPLLAAPAGRLSRVQTSPSAIGILDPQRFRIDGEDRITCSDTGREWPRTPVALTYSVPCRELQWSE